MAIEEGTKEISGESLSKEEIIPVKASDLDAIMKRLADLEQKKIPAVIPIDGTQAELAKAIKTLAEQLNKNEPAGQRGFKEHKYINPEFIDKDDLIEGGKVFYTNKVGYVIVDDKRNGQNILTPFETPIIFEYHANNKTGSGKEVNIHNIAKYVCYSKKEAEFIKNHTFFNVLFYEVQGDTISSDQSHAILVAKYVQATMNIGANKIVDMCRERGIPINDNLQAMRISLAVKTADEEVANNKKQNQIRVSDAVKEAQLFKDKS